MHRTFLDYKYKGTSAWETNKIDLPAASGCGNVPHGNLASDSIGIVQLNAQVLLDHVLGWPIFLC